MSQDTCMIDDCNKPPYVVALPHLTARQTFYMLYEQYAQAGWQDEDEGLVTDLSNESEETDLDVPVYINSVILRHYSQEEVIRLVLTEYAV